MDTEARSETAKPDGRPLEASVERTSVWFGQSTTGAGKCEGTKLGQAVGASVAIEGTDDGVSVGVDEGVAVGMWVISTCAPGTLTSLPKSSSSPPFKTFTDGVESTYIWKSVVGLDVGAEVGGVGRCVGALDGCSVGALDGVLVGKAVVGAGVGTAVGVNVVHM
jgi:hypothetical protein